MLNMVLVGQVLASSVIAGLLLSGSAWVKRACREALRRQMG